MEFYREAKEIDFEKASLEFEHIPSRIKDIIIYDYDLFTASKRLYKDSFRNGGNVKPFTYEECFELCKRYMAYLLAKSDFRNNKKVFVGYL